MKLSGQLQTPTGIISDKDPRWPRGGKLWRRNCRSTRTVRRREKSFAADTNWTKIPQISST